MPLVYKIFRAAEWEAFLAAGMFAGSADDARDGFIHLSSEDQIAGTLARHFASESALVIAAFEAVALGAPLKYEPSRSGRLFPHLYGALHRGALVRSERIERGPGGFTLPVWVEEGR